MWTVYTLLQDSHQGMGTVTEMAHNLSCRNQSQNQKKHKWKCHIISIDAICRYKPTHHTNIDKIPTSIKLKWKTWKLDVLKRFSLWISDSTIQMLRNKHDTSQVGCTSAIKIVNQIIILVMSSIGAPNLMICITYCMTRPIKAIIKGFFFPTPWPFPCFPRSWTPFPHFPGQETPFPVSMVASKQTEYSAQSVYNRWQGWISDQVVT